MSSDQLPATRVRYVAASGESFDCPLTEVNDAHLMTALPIRKVVGRKGRLHRPGLFWCSTTRAHVPYESWLELDRLWLADLDPQVTWVAAQPMALDGWDGNVRRRHVPDLLLRRRGAAPLVVDVKPERFARVTEVAAVFDWTGRVCRERGWDFEVWTGGDVDTLAMVRALGQSRRYGHPALPRLIASDTRRMATLRASWSQGDPAADLALLRREMAGGPLDG